MKNIVKITILAIFFTAIIGCSSSDDAISITDTVLEGKVEGTTFKALGGKAFDSGEKISVNITNIAADCTSTIFDYKYYVSTTIPAEVGVYESTNVVFHSENQQQGPLNFFGGTVEVVKVTNEEITIKIKANSDASNSVEGKFTVAYCK